jgi:hypothetical protein
MALSKFDFYYDRISAILKKFLFDKISLDGEEKDELNSFFELYDEIICENDVCRGNTCRFRGNPEDWVRYFGFLDLCDLVDHHLYGDKRPPKGDLLSAKHLRLSGNGFGNG